MRFLVDESTGPIVARWLEDQGHEVFSIYDAARGIGDEEIIQKAYDENWTLITNDKDFGEKVYREQFPHRGVILLRLKDERAVVKIETLRQLIGQYSARLSDSFVVVTESRVRFARA
jgi:predicted nuclease of predicted toxin-antitoxin system